MAVLYKPHKQTKLITLMREIHGDLSEEILLNLSFRCGDLEHSQWSWNEECHLLPLLVAERKKPIASICHRSRHVLHSIPLPKECQSFIYKNPWDVWVLLVYHQDDIWLEEQLIGLCNETLTFDQIGKMYGYN
jgi:hypothetical protein